MNIDHERRMFEAAITAKFPSQSLALLGDHDFPVIHGLADAGEYAHPGIRMAFVGWLAKAETVPVKSIAFAEDELDTQWALEFDDAWSDVYAKHRDALRAFLGVER